MGACCDRTIDIGCYSSCDTLLVANASYTGNITYEITTAGQVTQVGVATAISGSDIEILLSPLNENACHALKIYKGDGSVFLITINSIDYDCITFSTKIKIYI